MKQFVTILGFELKNYFKNKIFVGVTLFLVLAIAAVMFIPGMLSASEEPAPDLPAAPDTGLDSDFSVPVEEGELMLIKASSPEEAEWIRLYFSKAFPDYRVSVTEEDSDQIKDRIVSGEADCAFVMKDPLTFIYYVNNLSMYDMNSEIAAEVLQEAYRTSAMLESGMTMEEIEALMNVTVRWETESLGKDQFQNYFYTYIMIFALYMVILLYGQMVATNVAAEKSSRAMELLITSAKPTGMMFGKVIASYLAGLIQLTAVFGSAVLFYNLNTDYWGDNMIVASIFDMPLPLLGYMLLFFVLGFFLYAFLYGAVGSTVSKLEDINTAVMPLTFLFVAAFVVVVFSMTSGNVDNVLMVICSYIPFTSPMAMFTRIAMSTVPWYEILLSVSILIASVGGVGVLAAKIYRVGVLLYGTPPKPMAILKAVWKA